MNTQKRTMTRSHVLQTLALAPLALAGALAAVTAAEAATAEGNIAKTSVRYQATPKNGQQCSTCKYYINAAKGKTADGGCTQVAGSIGYKAWCLVYAKGDNSKQTL